MSLGSSRPKDNKFLWLFPAKSDTEIVSCVVSVQYNCDVLHSTASPSQTPMLLIIIVVPDPSIPERLMFFFQHVAPKYVTQAEMDVNGHNSC